MESPVRRLDFRDVNETFSFETEMRPIPSFRDRDVLRDVTNGTLCQAYGRYGFKVETAMN